MVDMVSRGLVRQMAEGSHIRFARSEDNHGSILVATYVDDGYVYLRMYGYSGVTHKASRDTGEMREFIGDSWLLIPGYFEHFDIGCD